MHSTNKALVLLKQVAMHHDTGLRLTDLIELTGFDKSTVHRQLQSLLEEGFVERVPSTKLYRLGMESMQLGFAANDMAPLVDRFRPLMLRIARISEDTVFLVVRSGDWGVCVHREEGAYPVKVFALEPGNRRLLGVSAVGISILAREDDHVIDQSYARRASAYAKLGFSLERLRSAVRTARRNGYSEMVDVVLDNAAGVGCSIRISAATQVGISIAAIGARMSRERRQELGTLLGREMAAFLTSAAPAAAPSPAAWARPARAARVRPVAGPGKSS